MNKTIHYDGYTFGIGSDIAAILGYATGEVYLDFTFDNGYSASLIRHNGSYGGKEGLFELMTIEPGDSTGNDVEGWLTSHDIQTRLKAIHNRKGFKE